MLGDRGAPGGGQGLHSLEGPVVGKTPTLGSGAQDQQTSHVTDLVLVRRVGRRRQGVVALLLVLKHPLHQLLSVWGGVQEGRGPRAEGLVVLHRVQRVPGTGGLLYLGLWLGEGRGDQLMEGRMVSETCKVLITMEGLLSLLPGISIPPSPRWGRRGSAGHGSVELKQCRP